MKKLKPLKECRLIRPLVCLRLCLFISLGWLPLKLWAVEPLKPLKEREWAAFFRLSAEERSLQRPLPQSLKGMHWTRRLAWLKTCEAQKDPWCEAALSEGLKDQAMVVRAQAAWAIGLSYRGSMSPLWVRELAESATLKENHRGGRPLLVMYRILFALHELGGTEALAEVEKISKKSNKLAIYWQKLAPESPFL